MGSSAAAHSSLCNVYIFDKLSWAEILPVRIVSSQIVAAVDGNELIRFFTYSWPESNSCHADNVLVLDNEHISKIMMVQPSFHVNLRIFSPPHWHRPSPAYKSPLACWIAALATHRNKVLLEAINCIGRSLLHLQWWRTGTSVALTSSVIISFTSTKFVNIVTALSPKQSNTLDRRCKEQLQVG